MAFRQRKLTTALALGAAVLVNRSAEADEAVQRADTARADASPASGPADASPASRPADASPASGPADMPSVTSAPSHAIDRTWLYLDDARVAEPLSVIGTTSLAYTAVGSNPDPTSAPYRGFAANTAQAGALATLGAEVGLLPRVSVEALGQMQLGGEGARVSPGAIAAIRVALLPPWWSSVHLTASTGYLRETSSSSSANAHDGSTGTELGGAHGAWASIALSVDVQRLRLGLTTLGEHVFAPGHDNVDVMVQAGASYRALSWLRLGVEWVGQDLEETFADEAEGGPRHFVGPTAALQLLRDRLTVVAGPSVGLSSRSPTALGRLAVAYGF